VQGLIGIQGLTGQRGFTGEPGFTGSRGFTGSTGGTGPAGSTGATGQHGTDGQMGATGVKGQAGRIDWLSSAATGVSISVSSCHYSAPDRGAQSVVMIMSVCLSVCLSMCLSAIISPELHVRSSPNFLCTLPMAVARFCSDNVLISYVFPVLSMTSYSYVG